VGEFHEIWGIDTFWARNDWISLGVIWNIFWILWIS